MFIRFAAAIYGTVEIPSEERYSCGIGSIRDNGEPTAYDCTGDNRILKIFRKARNQRCEIC
jgi:hypothetical protein